jgi:hypothetical protein
LCAVLGRNVNDTSITHVDKRRDFFVLLDGLLCIGGEDKSTRDKYQV